MSHVNIYVHAVWSTKRRFPSLIGKNRLDLLKHIRETALGADQSIAGIMNLIKGESSYWINKLNAEPARFSWQREYWAASVSYSQLKRVRNYIRDQEAHHNLCTFEEEKKEFVKEFGLVEIED